MTKNRAGPMPLQNALKQDKSLFKITRGRSTYPTPSFASMLWIVSKNPSFFKATFGWGESGEVFRVRTACEVCTTQIGLLMMVVAEPGGC